LAQKRGDVSHFARDEGKDRDAVPARMRCFKNGDDYPSLPVYRKGAQA